MCAGVSACLPESHAHSQPAPSAAASPAAAVALPHPANAKMLVEKVNFIWAAGFSPAAQGQMEEPICCITAISDQNNVESRCYVNGQVDTFAPFRHLFDIMSQQHGSYM